MRIRIRCCCCLPITQEQRNEIRQRVALPTSLPYEQDEIRQFCSGVPSSSGAAARSRDGPIITYCPGFVDDSGSFLQIKYRDETIAANPSPPRMTQRRQNHDEQGHQQPELRTRVGAEKRLTREGHSSEAVSFRPAGAPDVGRDRISTTFPPNYFSVLPFTRRSKPLSKHKPHVKLPTTTA